VIFANEYTLKQHNILINIFTSVGRGTLIYPNSENGIWVISNSLPPMMILQMAVRMVMLDAVVPVRVVVDQVGGQQQLPVA